MYRHLHTLKFERLYEGFFSILGTTGGIIKIFQIFNNTISRFMLKFLRQFVLKESEISRKNKREKIIEVIKLKDIEEKKNES